MKIASSIKDAPKRFSPKSLGCSSRFLINVKSVVDERVNEKRCGKESLVSGFNPLTKLELNRC
ncbi:MAG: hypothetical protein MJK14_16900, partial [Rivularia sp. ALOHA_DT_140]|nr:hypothetical protein [Rivularia sp. ALOHA_DT_140]